VTTISPWTQNKAVNTLLKRVARRAENASDETLLSTFVPAEQLMDSLDTDEHHVLFGRRGTGKTHILRFLANSKKRQGNLAAYVDLRRIGSAAGFYSSGEAVADHATQLLIDMIESIHTQLLDQITGADGPLLDRMEEISIALDDLATASTRTRIVGETESEHTDLSESISDDSSRAEARASVKSVSVKYERGKARKRSKRTEERQVNKGQERHHLLIGPLSRSLEALCRAISPRRVWIMLDEWSTIPQALQPVIADLIRRTMFPIPGVTVKISAIQRASTFLSPDVAGGYVGIDLGADTSSSLDLDDFLLFQNDRRHAHNFFGMLLYRHIAVMLADAQEMHGRRYALKISNPNEFVELTFGSRYAFDELVLAAEGVPRDAIHIVATAATLADHRPISVNNAHQAARDFYLRDKAEKITPDADKLLSQFIDDCARAKTRVLKLKRRGESDHPLVLQLYDKRLLHRVRQGVSAEVDTPSTLYDVYVLDFGCFIGLLGSGRLVAVDDGMARTARFADDAGVMIRSKGIVSVSWSDKSPLPRSR
jgi:hypothetical protein